MLPSAAPGTRTRPEQSWCGAVGHADEVHTSDLLLLQGGAEPFLLGSVEPRRLVKYHSRRRVFHARADNASNAWTRSFCASCSARCGVRSLFESLMGAPRTTMPSPRSSKICATLVEDVRSVHSVVEADPHEARCGTHSGRRLGWPGQAAGLVVERRVQSSTRSSPRLAGRGSAEAFSSAVGAAQGRRCPGSTSCAGIPICMARDFRRSWKSSSPSPAPRLPPPGRRVGIHQGLDLWGDRAKADAGVHLSPSRTASPRRTARRQRQRPRCDLQSER